MVPGRNFAKCPYVVNTGDNDAYVRIRVMIPTMAMWTTAASSTLCSALPPRIPVSSSTEQTGENWPVVEANGYTDENGLKYDVYTFTRTEPLKAGAMTEWNVWNFVGIGKNVTNADIEKAIEKGVITTTETGALSLNVLVQADAIQAEGFANAAAAWAAFK